jgi:hypothetical protein
LAGEESFLLFVGAVAHIELRRSAFDSDKGKTTSPIATVATPERSYSSLPLCAQGAGIRRRVSLTGTRALCVQKKDAIRSHLALKGRPLLASTLLRMTMKRLIVYVAAVLLASTAFAAPAKHITSPAEAFGFEPGTDRKLADWTQLVNYFQKLGTESDRVHFEEVGKTTEGRPYITVTISSPDTIAHLDRYKEIQRKLADPRITTPAEAKQLVVEGKTVIVVTCNIHSTEIASSQSATEFAYKLATGDTPEIQNILKNVIVVLVPSQNPDGEQLVVDWYKKYLGTPYEGSNPVVLWHHYVGHDDNRDWSSFTQVETRLAVEKVINPWHPQILYDLHQQGTDALIRISIRCSYRRSTPWAQTQRSRSLQREKQVCCRTVFTISGLRSGITSPITTDCAS